MVQKKIPSINSAHGSETRNIINEIIKAINDRGLEILSEEGFLQWLEQNKIKIEGTVQSVSDLPSNSPINTVYGVLDDNKLYIRKKGKWESYQTIDLNPLNEIDERLGSDLEQRGVNIAQPPFNLSPDGITDDTPVFQQAIDYLKSIGGGKLVVPKMPNPYTMIANSPTIQKPKRVLITSNDIHIEGVGKPTINMKGITKAYIDSIDDKSSSGRDVFTAFSFMRSKNSSIKGIVINGEWDGKGIFRYNSPRAKGVGFVGTENCVAEDLEGTGIFGNLVNATPSDYTIDGVYQSLYSVKVKDCIAIRCLENGFNFMGNTFDCSIEGSSATLCGSCGFEGGGEDLTVTNNTFTKNKVAGIATSAKRYHLKNNFCMDNNSVDGNIKAVGIQVGEECVDGIVDGNIIHGNESFGINMYPGASKIKIQNNNLKDNGKSRDIIQTINMVGTPTKKIQSIEFKNNTIENNLSHISFVSTFSYVENSTIKDNVINTTAGSVVYVQGSCDNVAVIDNKVNAPITISINANGSYAHNNLGVSPRTSESMYAPTSGNYKTGDYVRNTSPTVMGSTGAQYILKGWIRITDGNTHVMGVDWYEDKIIIGT